MSTLTLSTDSDEDFTESSLIDGLKNGEESTFRHLYNTLAPKLVELSAWLTGDIATGEDIVQVVFADLWLRRSTLVIRGSIRVYLYQAVRNRAAKHHRHNKVVDLFQRRGFLKDVATELRTSPPSPEQALFSSDIATAIHSALDLMPSNRRQVAILYFRHGMSYGEIAKIMGISESAAKMHFSRVRATLRPILEKVAGIEGDDKIK